MSKTDSEAARALRALEKCAFMMGVNGFADAASRALTAIEREDAERATTPAEPAAPAPDAEPVGTPILDHGQVVALVMPAAPAPDAEPVEALRDALFRLLFVQDQPRPYHLHDLHGLLAIHLAAAEQRGRANAEQRIAALREALDYARIELGLYDSIAATKALDALEADDAAREAGK